MKFGKEEEDNFQGKPIIKNSLSNNNNADTTKTILGKSSLFKFSKQQYDNNIRTIFELLGRIEKINKKNFTNQLNKIYGILMNIPYKYGRKYMEIGIEKEIKYLTKLGLPYLIKELEKQEIKKEYKKSLLNEIKEEFPLILKNFLVQQMKLEYYNENHEPVIDYYSHGEKQRKLELLLRQELRQEDRDTSYEEKRKKFEQIETNIKGYDKDINSEYQTLITQYKYPKKLDITSIIKKINGFVSSNVNNKEEEICKKIGDLLNLKAKEEETLTKLSPFAQVLKLKEQIADLEKNYNKTKEKYYSFFAINTKCLEYRFLNEQDIDNAIKEIENIAYNSLLPEDQQKFDKLNLITLEFKEFKAAEQKKLKNKQDLENILNNFFTNHNECIKYKITDEKSLQKASKELNISSFNSLNKEQQSQYQDIIIIRKQIEEEKSKLAKEEKNILDQKNLLKQKEQSIAENYGNKAEEIKQLEQELAKEKYKILLQSLKNSPDLKKVQLNTLKTYQEDYEKRTVKEKLAFYKEQIKAANNNNTILVAIANFYAWINEGISEELYKRIVEFVPKENLIKEGKEVPTTYLKYIRAIRHNTMHGLDDINRSKVLFTDIDIDKVRDAFIYLINSFEANIDFLYKIMGSVNHNIEITQLKHIKILAETLPKASMERNERGEKLPPSSEEQIKIFKSSIAIGQKIISELYNTLQTDLNNGITIEQLVALFNKMNLEQNMDKQDLQVVLKYDSALQALGQAIGNLQQYEELTDIDKLGINDDEDNFTLLTELIPLAKDYRTSCTHHCYYNKDSVDFILNTINADLLKLNKEFDLLYEKVRGAYLKARNKDFDNIYKAEKEQQNFVSMVTSRLPEAECRIN